MSLIVMTFLDDNDRPVYVFQADVAPDNPALDARRAFMGMHLAAQASLTQDMTPAMIFEALVGHAHGPTAYDHLMQRLTAK